MAKAGAPRKKSKTANVLDTAPVNSRGTKLSTSAKICNQEKFNAVSRMLDRVMSLKQHISGSVHLNLSDLFLNTYAVKKNGYKAFNNGQNIDLNAWELQALHHDICSDYQRKLATKFAKAKFKIQSGFVYEKYLRQVTKKLADGSSHVVATKGQVKDGTFELKIHQTDLTRISNFLLRCNVQTFDPQSLKEDHPMRSKMLQMAASPLWERLLNVVQLRQQRLIGKVSKIAYHSGTHRRNVQQSRSMLIMDPLNSKYKIFLQVRIGLGKSSFEVQLPMLVNKSRLKNIAKGNINDLMASEFRLKMAGEKIHFCTTYDAPEPEFAPFNAAIGLDVNSKHNLLARDDGQFFSLPELHFDGLLALLDKIDKNGGVSVMNWRRKAQLAKALRANEAAIQKILNGWLNDWLKDGVTDIWMEDLAICNDATFIRHHAFGADLGFCQKYSRMTRLLRLSAVKDWLKSMAEKRCIRVHTTKGLSGNNLNKLAQSLPEVGQTNLQWSCSSDCSSYYCLDTDAAYTSQECPHCHHVSRGNRLKQEEFICEECGFAANADTVASMNIKFRGVSDVLRSELHVFDRHQRASPNEMSRPNLKRHLMAQGIIDGGGVTELLTPPKKINKAIKNNGLSRSSD